jgi:hypothetical protein
LDIARDAQEVLSPALLEQSTGKYTSTPSSRWDEMAAIMYNTAYGPFQVPSDKILLHPTSRTHSPSDVESLADAMINDDQRKLCPIMVELHPDVTTLDSTTGQSYNIPLFGNLPQSILTDNPIIGYVLHGSKRLLASRRLIDDHVYVMLLSSGTS